MRFRAFLGLTLDAACVRELAMQADSWRLRDKKSEIRWSDPGNFHLTLAFLGDIEDGIADPLMAALCAEVETRAPFTLQAEELTYFPASSRPRVVLARVAHSEALDGLQRRVLAAVRAVGLETEKRRFMPHITLGRLRHRHTPWLRIPPTPLAAASPVHAVCLFRSDLDPRGARYRVLAEAGLSGDS